MQALILAPSRGRGGGIERYVQTIEWAFASEGVGYRRIDLRGSGPAAHARLLAESRAMLQPGDPPARIVVAHRALLPAAALIARKAPGCGISLICHGMEVWGPRLEVRQLIENRLMRSQAVRVIAVGGFTAGVLSYASPATVLPPGLTQAWFDALVDASLAPQPSYAGIRLVTTFRLADWREKGLPELLRAVARLGRPEVGVTVCGSGEPPVGLRKLVAEHRSCSLRSGLSDAELAAELAAADLCVLATRTRCGRNRYGEGFGLVLIEAQVAGTPVIAPAYGGSCGAFIDGVTGVAPADESAASLAKALGELLRDPQRLSQMGKAAAGWSREAFSPSVYAPLAVAKLL